MDNLQMRSQNLGTAEMKEKAVQIINEAFEDNGIKVLKIILFGSRARGDFDDGSDWDFLVLIDKDLSFHEKWRIVNQIQRTLARLKIFSDIIVKSERQFNVMKNYVGNISYYASREGVEI